MTLLQQSLSHSKPIKTRSFTLIIFKHFTIFIIGFFLLFYSNSAFAANRIVSLIPSSTELICAIGFKDEIIAVSNFCNYPSEVTEKLPKIGDQNLNVEKILSLKPTILVDTNGIHKRYEGIFQKLKLNYFNIDIKSQENIPTAALALAEKLGNKEKANKFINNWNQELAKIKVINNQKTPKIYMEIWDNPIQAVGCENNIDSIIQVAGGKNVLNKQKDYPVVNSEMILLLNPDIILLAYPEADTKKVAQRPGWKNIRAVKNDNIYIINQDEVVRPSPRNLEAIKSINEIINKVIFDDEK